MNLRSDLSAPASRRLRQGEGLAMTSTLLALIPMQSGIAQEAAPVTDDEAAGELSELVVDAEAGETLYKPERLASPRFTQPLVDQAQTLNVIPQEVMRERHATSLTEVLKNVPGVTIAAGEGGAPPGDNFTIRGFSARTDMFVDGVRDFGGYSRDPFNIEQVEVAKGPASANNGRGSTGGSINLVTKKPYLGRDTSIMLGGGTDDYGRVTLDHNQEISALNGTAFRFNSVFHTQSVPGREIVDQERWGIAPSISFGLGTDTRFTLSYFHLEQDNLPDYGIPWVNATKAAALGIAPGAPDVDYGNFYGLLSRDFEEVRTDMVTAIFEHDFSENLRLTNLSRFGRNDRFNIVTAPRFLDDGPNTIIRRTDWKTRDQVDEIFSNLTTLNYDFLTGGVRHELVAGFDIAHESSDNDTYTDANGGGPPTDLYNPTPGDFYRPAMVYNGTNSATATSLGIFLGDTAELSERWELSGALRWDSFDLKYTDSAGTSFEQRDEMLSYRAALVYKPRENGSVYFGYGTSFNPSAEGLTLNAATANVDPEESRTMELGTKWELFDQRLLATAALFRTDKTNARTQNPVDPALPEVLDGEQRVQGVELGFTGSITDTWRIVGGYTYIDSEILSSNSLSGRSAAPPGNELANTPEHSFTLWSVHELPAGFQAGVGVQYIGERYNNNGNTYLVDDYLLFDAMVGYRLNENVSFQLNGYNLGDKEYIAQPGGGHFIPGPGRAVVLSANITF